MVATSAVVNLNSMQTNSNSFLFIGTYRVMVEVEARARAFIFYLILDGGIKEQIRNQGICVIVQKKYDRFGETGVWLLCLSHE